MAAYPRRPMRTLIVSQDVHWRLQYTRALLAQQCDVHTAARGFDALDLLRKSIYELVIVDESLDYLGLVEFTLNLRDLLEHLPVTLVAGNNLRHFDRIWQQCEMYYVGDQANLLAHLPGAIAEAEKRMHAMST